MIPKVPAKSRSASSCNGSRVTEIVSPFGELALRTVLDKLASDVVRATASVKGARVSMVVLLLSFFIDSS